MNSEGNVTKHTDADVIEHKYPKPNRTIKDSVFKELFSQEKYLRELIVTLLGPERADNEIIDMTLSNVLASGGVFNDLSFCLREEGKKDYLVLIEEQSTWSIGIVYRIGGYYFHTMENYFTKKEEDIYHLSESEIPDSALFVVYTGKANRPPIISFRENLTHNPDYPVDVTVKVITSENAAGILREYILFCQLLDSKREGSPLTIEDIREVLDECISKGILKEFLLEHKTEVIEVLESLFNQEVVTRNENLRHFREGEKKGEERGDRGRKIKSAIKMLKSGAPDKDILDWQDLSKPELEELKKMLKEGKEEQILAQISSES